MNIPIFEPFLTGNEKKYVNRCLDTNWISSQGEYVLKFEEELALYHNMKYCIATSSCTTALHLSLKAYNIGSGDEVICPDLTFIAPANMIVLSSAKLVLVDIDPKTLTIAPDLIEDRITEKTKAIIVIHQFGHSAHMNEILDIAHRHNLIVIEDNAESIGAKYKGKLLGTIGHISTFSFFANKIITSGEGGAILTNDKNIADRCRELRDHGMSLYEKYHHIDLGYNYRMTNLQAAVGLAQLEKLDEILQIRMKQMHLYYNYLKDNHGFHLREFADWTSPVHWLMTITLDKDQNRSDLISYMKNHGIECRTMINPVHCADHFIGKYNKNIFNNSTDISSQSIHLPSSTNLDYCKIEYICNNIINYFYDNINN